MDADSRPRYRQGVITRLEIENFKAIRKVAFDLRPLTVLVGPNDSGKSSLLQALGVASRSAQGSDAMPFHEAARPSVFPHDPAQYFAGGDRTLPLRIDVTGSTAKGESFRHELRAQWAAGDYQVGRHFENAGALAAELPSFSVAFDPMRLSIPSAANADLQGQGDGLPGVIKRLLTSLDRKPLERFEAGLRRISKHVERVATRTLPDGREELWFSGGESGNSFPAREASSGIVLVAGYLALLHGTPYQRFLIEEPENGVHPHAILTIVDVLREIVTSGKQVVMTTHSPALLDYMDPADVLVVTRDQEAGVTVTPVYRTRFFDEDRQRVDLGELWYSVGDVAMVSTAQ